MSSSVRDVAAVVDDEVAVLADRLQTSPLELVALLAEVAAGLPADPDHQVRSLTHAEEAELRVAGSLAAAMPPLGERASTAAVRAVSVLRAQALTVAEAAAQLHVTPGRVRQRLAAGTLAGFRTTDGWRLPEVQFDDDGELPGLATVLAVLPADVHPVALTAFLTRAHPDLVVDTAAVSPRAWLLGGGEPRVVAAAAADAYRVR